MSYPLILRCPFCRSPRLVEDDERGPITKSLDGPFVTQDGMKTKSVAHAYRCDDCGDWVEVIAHRLARTANENE